MGVIKRPLKRSITIAWVLFTIPLCIVLSVMSYRSYRATLYAQYESRMTDILRYVAGYVDVEDMLECSMTGKKSESYRTLQRVMDGFADSTSIDFIYMDIPWADADHQVQIKHLISGNTAEEYASNAESMLPLNYMVTDEEYPQKVKREYLDAFLSDEEITFFEEETPWAIDYTGCMTICDAEGNRVLQLNVDVAIDDVYGTVRRHTTAIIATIMLTGLGFIVLFYMWADRNITGPLAKLERSVAEFAQASHEGKDADALVFHAPEVHTKNEIESLTDSVEKLSVDIRDNVDRIIEKENKIVQIERMSEVDPLTRVKNKRAYDKELDSLDWSILTCSAQFGIVMVDLNFLKRVNDTYGHDKGNTYIVESCQALCNVWQHSPVYRIGGDEFVIVLMGTDYENRDSLFEAAVDIFRQRSEDMELEPWHRLSAAFGMAVYEEGDEDSSAVFKRADEQMYANKIAMKAERE